MSTLFDTTLCVAVTFHRPGAVRAFRAGEVEVRKTGANGETDKASQSEVGANRVIFRNEFYKQACDIAAEFRLWLEKRELDLPLGHSVHILPRSMVEEVKAEFEQFRARYLEAADKFCAPVEYLRTKMQARARLKELWDEKVYPTREGLRAKFYVDWWEMEFAGNSEEALQQAEQDVIQALRQSCADLVGHLAEKLQPIADGKKRRLHPSAVKNVTEFLDLFEKRNVLQDTELESLVSRARRLLNGDAYNSLKENDTLRDYVGKQMSEIKQSLDTLITAGPRRVVSFEED